MEPEKPTIGWYQGGAAIGLAFLGDLIQAGIDFITFGFGWTVNWMVVVVFIFYFWLWLAIKKKLTLKRVLILIGVAVGDAVPYLGDLPLLTGITVKVMYDIIKQESKLGKLVPKIKP